MKRICFYLAAISLLMLTISCEKQAPEENTEVQEVPESEMQLMYLKESLLYTDEEGNVSLLRGIALDSADPTNVSISVSGEDEAYEEYAALFSENTPYSDQSCQFTLLDNLGTARFYVNDSPEDGVVAYAEFDIPSIPQISRMNYVLESAWPENAASRGKYKRGQAYSLEAWDYVGESEILEYLKGRKEWFVCLREDKNGNPALLVAVSEDQLPTEYMGFNTGMCRRVPSMDRAKKIQELIVADWDVCCYWFNAKVPNGLTSDQRYWIDSGSWSFLFVEYRDTIRLSDGNIKRYDAFWADHKFRYLLFREMK